MSGPDHTVSLEPSELKKMIEYIRNVELALGVEKKIITVKEKITKELVRQSVHAKKNIKKGEKFSIENIILMRPATGEKPVMFNKILKKKANKNFVIHDCIKI